MNRLRRLNDHSLSIPVAAEVLEVRSLLSAGVHAAVAHAQHVLPAGSKPAVPTILFPASTDSTFDIHGTVLGAPFVIKSLHFTTTSQHPTGIAEVGKSVKFTVNELIGQTQGDVTINSIKGTIGGKIAFINSPGGGANELEIVPSGHFTISATVSGHKINVTVSPDASHPLLLDIDSVNNFGSLRGDYQLTKPTGATGFALFGFNIPGS